MSTDRTLIRRWRRGCLIACALVLALAAPAWADDPPSEEDKAAASVRFKKGVELYKAGDVQAALIEFRRAYKLAPNYKLLFNIGQASAELRDYVGAHNSFTQYLRDGGDDISPERREMVESELERLQGYLARLDIKVRTGGAAIDGAEVAIDGVVVGISPLSEPVLVSAGRREIVVTREGYARWDRALDVAGEDNLDVAIELTSLASERPEDDDTSGRPERRARSRSNTGLWVSAGATVVLGLGTGVAGFLTLRAQSEHEDALATVPITQADIDDSADKTRRMALLTDIGLGLTLAAGVTTLVLALRSGGDSSAPEKSARSLDVSFSPNGVVFSGRF